MIRALQQMRGIDGVDGGAKNAAGVIAKIGEGWRSVKLRGVGPAGQAGDRVELAQQPGDHLLGVVLRAELFELAEDARQRLVGVGDRALGEVLALRGEALAMSGELGSIEVGGAVNGALRTLAGLTTRAMRLLAWDI